MRAMPAFGSVQITLRIELLLQMSEYPLWQIFSQTIESLHLLHRA